METGYLPPEILEKFFLPLAPPDLKNCVLVNEEWRAVGEDPSLWTWCTVTIRRREDLAKLSVRRFKNIQTIRIKPGEDWGVGDWEALLQDVAAKKYSKLKKICGLGRTNLFSVNIEPEVIAGAIVQLEDVDLSGLRLSTEQISSILTIIAREGTIIEKLSLYGIDLSGVEPEDLALSLIQLEEVDLRNTKVSTEQITNILANIAQGNTKLKKMNLAGNDLSGVDPEALSRGLVQLEEVELVTEVLAKDVVQLEEANLRGSKLSTEQISSILTNIAMGDTKLKKLSLCAMYGNDLAGVESETLARSLIQLEEVDLRNTKLSTEQITSILTSISTEDNKIKKWNLYDNDLSGVEPEALARGLMQLEEVNLSWTKLSTEQITKILTNIAQKETKLKKLNLDINDLSGVEAEDLARGTIQLEEVNLSDTKLRTEQITSILTRNSQEDTKLKKLNLEGNDLSDVEPEALAKALIQPEEVHLGGTKLGTEQITRILTSIAQEDTSLKKLNLKWNNLSKVDPEALARAFIKLEVVNLARTKLSTEQINSILTNIEEAKLIKLDMRWNNMSGIVPEVISRAVNILQEFNY